MATWLTWEASPSDGKQHSPPGSWTWAHWGSFCPVGLMAHVLEGYSHHELIQLRNSDPSQQ